jgi:CRP-like cAMP-binding protein
LTAEEVLSSVELFEDFPKEFLAGLAAASETRSYSKGDEIVRQGEPADAFFVISRGTAEVALSHDGQEHVIATLGKGSFFGEMAFLREGTRTATVRAASDADCIVLTRSVFDAELRRHPNEAAVLMPRLARRLRVIEQ